jgi:hypothetical protein
MNNPKENIKTHIRQFIICNLNVKALYTRYKLSINSKNVGEIEIHKNK